MNFMDFFITRREENGSSTDKHTEKQMIFGKKECIEIIVVVSPENSSEGKQAHESQLLLELIPEGVPINMSDLHEEHGDSYCYQMMDGGDEKPHRTFWKINLKKMTPGKWKITGELKDDSGKVVEREVAEFILDE